MIMPLPACVFFLAFFVDFWKVLYEELFHIHIREDDGVYRLKILIFPYSFCISNSLYIPYFPDHCPQSRSLDLTNFFFPITSVFPFRVCGPHGYP